MATKAEKSLSGKNLEKTSGGRVRYERFRRPLRFSLRVILFTVIMSMTIKPTNM